MDWVCKGFDDLTVGELYAILVLRCQVFVVEQACVYQDADGLDRQCLHCFGCMDGEVVAYIRLIPPGVVYEVPAMGRFVTSPKVRRTGLGRQLLRYAIGLLFETWPTARCEISAQLYLRQFYEQEGFEVLGVPYEEDGIPHVHMACRRESIRS